jgi:hypothetical protein
VVLTRARLRDELLNGGIFYTLLEPRLSKAGDAITTGQHDVSLVLSAAWVRVIDTANSASKRTESRVSSARSCDWGFTTMESSSGAEKRCHGARSDPGATCNTEIPNVILITTRAHLKVV